jgi:inner membrane protein
MLAPTHFFFALALAYLLRMPRLPMAIGGIAPDLDVLLQESFPLVHRGIVHTPFFLAVSVVLLFLISENWLAYSFGAGFLAHLLLDVITPVGIPLLYPLQTYFSLSLVTYNNVIANLGIIGFSLLTILIYRSSGFQDWIQRVFSISLESRRSFHE